jgi:hypothetical protein
MIGFNLDVGRYALDAQAISDRARMGLYNIVAWMSERFAGEVIGEDSLVVFEDDMVELRDIFTLFNLEEPWVGFRDDPVAFPQDGMIAAEHRCTGGAVLGEEPFLDPDEGDVHSGLEDVADLDDAEVGGEDRVAHPEVLDWRFPERGLDHGAPQEAVCGIRIQGEIHQAVSTEGV